MIQWEENSACKWAATVADIVIDIVYLRVIWLNAANKKRVASEKEEKSKSICAISVFDPFCNVSWCLNIKDIIRGSGGSWWIKNVCHLSIFSTSSSSDCWNLLLTVEAWYRLVTVLLFLTWPVCWLETSAWTMKSLDTIWTHTGPNKHNIHKVISYLCSHELECTYADTLSPPTLFLLWMNRSRTSRPTWS